MNALTRLSDWYANLSPRGLWLVRCSVALVVALVLIYRYLLPLDQVWLELPIADSSSDARSASIHFWEVFHSGSEDTTVIDGAIQGLDDALLEAPEDLLLTQLAAIAHLWRFHVRDLYGKSVGEFRKDLEVSSELSERVIRAAPDPHSTMPTSLAMADWQLGVLRGERVAGSDVHLDVLDNSMVFPTFALFIQGWMLGAMLSADDPHFQESPLGYALNVNACVGLPQPHDVQITKFKQTFMSLKIWLLGDRICYNNPMAPHNVEGMFFVIGDTYVKMGDFRTARIMYENVKQAPTYDEWRFRDMLEHRLENMEALRDKFQADSGRLDVQEPAMNFQSRYACAICHAS